MFNRCVPRAVGTLARAAKVDSHYADAQGFVRALKCQHDDPRSTNSRTVPIGVPRVLIPSALPGCSIRDVAHTSGAVRARTTTSYLRVQAAPSASRCTARDEALATSTSSRRQVMSVQALLSASNCPNTAIVDRCMGAYLMAVCTDREVLTRRSTPGVALLINNVNSMHLFGCKAAIPTPCAVALDC
jgi:hypothetical protein